MEETQRFYKSRKWEAFRKVIVEQRTDADGFVRCAICGQPILKKYDLIIHHKTELNEANVNDATVSLNPDNVECVHFKCHNKIHNRFSEGHAASSKPQAKKQVVIVYGAPCSGKTTWVHENATENDIVVDLDSIYEAISINPRYKKTTAQKAVVFEVRDKLYDLIKHRFGRWENAFIITGGARAGDRERLSALVGADHMIFIDASREECVKRCFARNENAEEWIEFIDEWFETYQPDESDPL